MNNSRQELLCLLHDACMYGQGAAQLLTVFLERHRDCGQDCAEIEISLAKTVENQRLLAECLARIAEKTEVPLPQAMDCSTALRLEDPSAENVLRELSHLRTGILQEIERYSCVIATAEVSGFFQTRLVCEGGRSDKLSMAAWLEQRASLNDQPGPA